MLIVSISDITITGGRFYLNELYQLHEGTMKQSHPTSSTQEDEENIYTEARSKRLKRRKITSSTDSDVDEPVPSKSFYGSSRTKYIDPLERRDINNLKKEKEVASQLQTAPGKQTPKSASKLSTITKIKSLSSPKTQTKPKPSTSKVSAEDSDSPKVDSPAKPSSSKKFFKNNSPGNTARRAGMSVSKTKGFNVRYKPSGVGKRERSPKKPLLTGNMKFTIGKGLPSPLRTSRRTPSKNSTPKKDIESFQNGPSTPTSRTSTPAKGTPSKGKKAAAPMKCIAGTPGKKTPRKEICANSPSTPQLRRTPRRIEQEEIKNRQIQDLMYRNEIQDFFSNDQEEEDSGIEKNKPTPDFEYNLFESPAKSSNSVGVPSTSPDSVMLLSDLGSTSSPHSCTSSKLNF